MPLRTLSDYPALFLNDVPLIDVRAPVEFAQGALPTAVNLPLMTDEQRHRVGAEYAQHGRQAAIELGVRLVSGAAKQHRIHAWETFAGAHPGGALYCARGGLRSRISQQARTRTSLIYKVPSPFPRRTGRQILKSPLLEKRHPPPYRFPTRDNRKRSRSSMERWLRCRNKAATQVHATDRRVVKVVFGCRFARSIQNSTS